MWCYLNGISFGVYIFVSLNINFGIKDFRYFICCYYLMDIIFCILKEMKVKNDLKFKKMY